jgi:hypothetical protein
MVLGHRHGWNFQIRRDVTTAIVPGQVLMAIVDPALTVLLGLGIMVLLDLVSTALLEQAIMGLMLPCRLHSHQLMITLLTNTLPSDTEAVHLGETTASH